MQNYAISLQFVWFQVGSNINTHFAGCTTKKLIPQMYIHTCKSDAPTCMYSAFKITLRLLSRGRCQLEIEQTVPASSLEKNRELRNLVPRKFWHLEGIFISKIQKYVMEGNLAILELNFDWVPRKKCIFVLTMDFCHFHNVLVTKTSWALICQGKLANIAKVN